MWIITVLFFSKKTWRSPIFRTNAHGWFSFILFPLPEILWIAATDWPALFTWIRSDLMDDLPGYEDLDRKAVAKDTAYYENLSIYNAQFSYWRGPSRISKRSSHALQQLWSAWTRKCRDHQRSPGPVIPTCSNRQLPSREEGEMSTSMVAPPSSVASAAGRGKKTGSWSAMNA